MPDDHRLGLRACASPSMHLSSVAGYTPGLEGALEFELSGQAGTQALVVCPSEGVPAQCPFLLLPSGVPLFQSSMQLPALRGPGKALSLHVTNGC